jgi:DNA-binding transcriptional ArsR family regulator
MSDVFKAIADPKSRLVLEKLAHLPASTVAKLSPEAGLTAEQTTKQLTELVAAGLIKSTGSGASKKYSLNPKGFGPYVAWLAKVAETQAVANLELQLVDVSEKIGGAIATGSEWIGKKVSENVDVDPKKWAKELGRILAEVKAEVQKEAQVVAKETDKVVKKVVKRVKR